MKLALERLQLSTRVLCLCAVAYWLVLTVGLLIAIPIHRTVLISGFVVALIAVAVSLVWLALHVSTALEAKEKRDHSG